MGYGRQGLHVQVVCNVYRKDIRKKTICFMTRPSGAPLHTLSKLYDVPVGSVSPLPSNEAVYCFICGHRRVAIARYHMICLVLVINILFLSKL